MSWEVPVELTVFEGEGTGGDEAVTHLATFGWRWLVLASDQVTHDWRDR